MLNQVSRNSIDRFLPTIVGIGGVITVPILSPAARAWDFLVMIGILFPLVAATAYWFTFGTTRFWIRYIVFSIVFFAMPVLVMIFGRGSSGSYMFSAFGVMLAILDHLLKICGVRVQRVIEYRKSSSNRAASYHEQRNNYTIRDLMQLTLFIGVTMAAFAAWDRALSLDWKQIAKFVSWEPEIITFYILNCVTLIAALAQRKVILWVIGAGIASYFCTDAFGRLPGGRESAYFVLYIFSMWLITYSIPRIRGYRWTWHMPFKKRSREGSESEIDRSASDLNAAQITAPPIVTNLGDQPRPIPPPLPHHSSGVKVIAEPPIVASHSTPPPLPKLDEH